MVKMSTGTNTQANRTKLICQGCGDDFYPKSGHLGQKYCSRSCGYRHRKTGGKKGKTYPHTRRAAVRKCLKCGQEFRAVNDSNGIQGGTSTRKQLYCSIECWRTRKPPVDKTCMKCGSPFQTYNHNQKYCSHECLWTGKEYPKGPDAPRWKDGSSLKNDRARSSGQLSRWRRLVYKRDNFTCQVCGKTNCYLNAHHIKHFADNEKLRFDVDNGVTLCVECHGEKHGRDFTQRKDQIKINGQEVNWSEYSGV
jgi:hypothetical protein